MHGDVLAGAAFEWISVNLADETEMVARSPFSGARVVALGGEWAVLLRDPIHRFIDLRPYRNLGGSKRSSLMLLKSASSDLRHELDGNRIGEIGAAGDQALTTSACSGRQWSPLARSPA